MGVMFTLNNGNLVDLWSFGNTAPVFFGAGVAGWAYLRTQGHEPD